MRKVKIMNAFSLVFNALIAGLAIYPFVNLITSGATVLATIPFYDVLASLFLALVCVICIPFNIVGIAKGKKLPRGLNILKLAAVVGSLVVFIYNIDISVLTSKNYVELLGNFDFQLAAPFFCFIVPVLGLISYTLFDLSERIKFPAALLGGLIPLLYFGAYLLNTFIKVFSINGVFDFAGILNGTSTSFIMLAVIVVSGFVLAILLFLLNGAISKAYYKEAVLEEKPIEEEPSLIIEESHKEEVKEEEPVEVEKKEEAAPVVEEVKEEPVEEVVEEKVEEPAEAEEKEAEEPAEEEKPSEEKKAAPVKKAPAKKAAPIKEEKKAAPAKAEKKAAPAKKAPAKKEAEPVKKEGKEAPTKVYHLTKRKEDGMWAITFVGGQKAVKLFKTKKEAEEYLETLTKNQGATALIRNSKGAKAGKFASSIKAEEEK